MDTSMDTLKKDIESALLFLGQAQERAPNSSDLWQEIGRMYDELDSLLDGINDGDFGQDGKLR